MIDFWTGGFLCVSSEREKAQIRPPLFVNYTYCIYRLDSIYGLVLALVYGLRSILLPLCITVDDVLSTVEPSTDTFRLPATVIV